jgi:GTPase SAR1 family protein
MVESLLRHNRFVPWNRSKIMLVGQGRAGKTALANGMMGKKFIPDTKSTVGAEKFETKFMSGKIKKGENGAVLAGYVPSPQELESMMALTASRQMKGRKVKKSVEDGNSKQLSSTNADNTFSGVVSVNFRDVNTAVFNKCLFENIAKNVTDSDLVISLYDFGGQDIFNVLHPFFMSKYGVYVVVFDMELFLSNYEQKRESCMKHLKFWMNSIAMHTYDASNGKTAPVAIVGTRGDLFRDPKDREVISRIIEGSFYQCVAWKSLLVSETDALCFFPVDNVNLDVTVNHLLQACQSHLENALFMKQEVSLVWVKLLDEINAKHQSFLSLEEIIRMCEPRAVVSAEVTKMLTFFYEMGILIWINEENLRDVVILDPIEYFVKPATMIICKHIATKDDPYRTVHFEEIHKACRKKWREDWYQMLEFGLVSERLARRLLASVCKNEAHVDNVLLLMERYGLTTGFHVIPQRDEIEVSRLCFLPAVAPSDPKEYFVDRECFEDYSIYKDYDNLIGRLSTQQSYCFQPFECIAFHFAFSVSTETDLLKLPLFSANELASYGFLPNGLFERFVGRVLGSLVCTVSDVSASLLRTSFIGFKDVVKLKFMFRNVRITNLLGNNMIRIEVERDPEEDDDKGTLMFIHDSLYEMVQTIIRECYKNLLVVTLLLTDQQDYHNHPLLPLSELKSVVEGKMRRIDYHTVDGKQVLSMKAKELETSFDIWLNTSTIHPKKGQYVNKVRYYLCMYVYSSVLVSFL